MRVVVADDSRVMRQIVVRTLRQAGFKDWEILQAGDGAEALALTLAEQPDLVLSDWNMPEMNGIDLLRALRTAGRACRSGSSRRRARRRCASSRTPRAPCSSSPSRSTRTRSRTSCARTSVDPDVRPRRSPCDHDPLPELKEIRDLYAGLVGRGCTAVRASALLTPETRPGVIAATYVSHRAQVEAVVAVDVPLGAHLGASIGLVPPGPAQDAAADGALSDVLLENLSEVLNVTAALFNAEGAPHLKLAEVFDSTRGPLPGAPVTFLRSTGRRLDAEIEIAGYGGGALTVVLA